MNSNKYVGNRYERAIGGILADNGFWVHNFQQNASGQPADLIAVNQLGSHLIDCKHCVGHRFVLDRVEENQKLSMDHWQNTIRRPTAWFCIGFIDDTYMVPWNLVKEKIDGGSKSLGETWISTHCKNLLWWMESWK